MFNKTIMLRSTLIIALTVSTSIANASKQIINDEFMHPGGIADIYIEKQSPLLPQIKYGIQQPVIIEQKHFWRVLIGLGLDTVPGEYLLYVRHNIEGATSEHINFFIEQKKQPILLVKKERKKKLNIRHKELSILDYDNTQQPNLPLNWPANGNWNKQFGTVEYNQKNNKSDIQNHLYLETDSIINVRSPENAIISNIVESDDGSVTVLLDHGRGLYSAIGGITDLNVDIGNGVVNGSVIGKVTPTTDPNSGKVENKILTWQNILNGIYVNPEILSKL